MRGRKGEGKRGRRRRRKRTRRSFVREKLPPGEKNQPKSGQVKKTLELHQFKRRQRLFLGTMKAAKKRLIIYKGQNGLE
jgi:hypothetical protein